MSCAFTQLQHWLLCQMHPQRSQIWLFKDFIRWLDKEFIEPSAFIDSKTDQRNRRKLTTHLQVSNVLLETYAADELDDKAAVEVRHIKELSELDRKCYTYAFPERLLQCGRIYNKYGMKDM